jgi:hypothetical protein
MDGFCAQLFAKWTGKTKTAKLLWFGRYLKKTEGGGQNFDFFRFCAAIFSPTTAFKNNPIILI